MAALRLSTSPHVHSGKTTGKIMGDVCIALLPALIAGTVVFGFRSLAVVLTCVVTCVLAEFVFTKITKKETTIGDFSAVVTGLLLGLNMPSTLPLWEGVVGSLFAILFVKCFFGGIGFNVVNPAITARVFMLIAFSDIAKFNSYTHIVVGKPDAVATATPLVQIGEGNLPSLKNLFLGNVPGCIGETCALALLIGGIYLICRKVITWHIPVCYIGTVFVLSYLLGGFDFQIALAYILSGGLFLGAIFMATDYVTSPSTPKGKVIFAVGCGLLTVLIRFYGNYPEGVSFSILLMNILNPFICKWSTRKVFGGKKA